MTDRPAHPESYGHWDHSQISDLLYERDALLKDAERYRWLRNEANFGRKHDPICVTGIGPEATAIDGDELDAAIDAAMAAKEQR